MPQFIEMGEEAGWILLVPLWILLVPLRLRKKNPKKRMSFDWYAAKMKSLVLLQHLATRK